MTTATDVAWVSLRLVYAWMFLYPAVGLIKQWPTTVETTALLFKWRPELFAAGALALMIGGSAMILLGVYGWVAGAGFVVFSIGGALVHYHLAARARETKLSEGASTDDINIIEGVVGLAVVGNVTSAEKNFVLAAVGLFFFLMGTGPLSLVDSGPPF